MTTETEIISSFDVTRVIHLIRDRRVIIDADLARIFEVATKRLNEQLRRNLDRFPDDFAFQLTEQEWASLRSQTATLNSGRGAHRKYLPYVFSEHGALMAANILNSPRAIAMSVYVIRAFVKLREETAANAAILRRLAEIDKTLLIHDTALRDILQKLRPLLEPPPQPPKPEIGFHIKEDALPYSVRKRSRSVNSRRQAPKNTRTID